MASKKLHIAVLEKDIARTSATIDRSLKASLKELVRLQRIIVRPGWTTPAEYLLVRAALQSAAARAQALTGDLSRVVGTAATVGRPGGVIIIDG